MINRNMLIRLGLVVTLAVSGASLKAQDIHFTQFDASPLTVNPAFTGLFNGKIRVCGIYRNQWASVTVPYKTFGASVDLPIIWRENGYLAVGLQVFNDQAGDLGLTNFTGMGSIAYHLTVGDYRNEDQRSDIAVGLQAGYCTKSLDLSKAYFGDEFVNGIANPGTSAEYLQGINNGVNYYLVNAGIAYSKSFSSNFGLTLGAGANNLNMPNDGVEKKQNSQTALDMRWTGQMGINWLAGDKLSLRPAVLYQYQAAASEIIAGNEFHYMLSNMPSNFSGYATAVFLGGWYRTGDAFMVTAGFEFKGIRVGVGYDYNNSSLNAASNGNGGYEISVRYLAPWPAIYENRSIPCMRF
jgi:type IX secretion system PorP/SprF family membrane protein